MCNDCEPGRLPDNEDQLGDAITLVVGALSPVVKHQLLESLIGDMIGNVGDNSDLEQFNKVLASMPQRAFYKPDKAVVRQVLCAAAACTSMVVQGDMDGTQAVRLASAVLNKRSFDEPIR